MKNKRPKIAVFVDLLTQLGGVERMVMMLGKYFDVDVYTGRYDKEKTFQEFKDMNIFQITKSKRRIFNELAHIEYRKAFRTLNLKKKYEHHIIFGGASLCVARKYHPNTWYCNAPIRWLYDLKKHEEKRLPIIKRLPFRIFSYFIKKDDQECVKHVDKIVTNSENVSKRIRRFYNREPDKVIHPPTNLNDFFFKKYGEFYLSTERIDPINRVYLVVRAFQKMPDKKIIITSGGTDMEKIKKLSKGYDNIKIKGWVEEKELYELYATCLAGITMEKEADYSMIPNEFNAAGKPCFCAKEGGLPETIVEGKSGFFVEPPVTADKIREAINKITKEQIRNMKEDCFNNAKKVSEENFIRNIKKVMKIKE